VTKQGLFLTSFVAAIPGAFLAVLMAISFLKYAGGPSLWTKGLAGMLFLIGGLLAVMPVGIFLFAGPKTEKPPEKKPTDESSGEEGEAEPAADSGDEFDSRHAATIISDSEEFESHADVTDSSLQVVEGEPDEFSVTGEVVTDDSAAEEFGSDADSDFEVNSGDDDEPFDFDEDEPKPGKKK
jgi:hypothetical protein